MWDASEGGVVSEAAVKHLVNHSLRLLPAHLAYGEDGAQRSAPHTLLREQHNPDTQNTIWPNNSERREQKRYLMVLFEAKVKSGNLVNERTVSAQIGGTDLKSEQTQTF